MASLDKLNVHHFRHVMADTSLVFDAHQNVILGQNGTGKTTLLMLVSATARNNLQALAQEAFDLEWWMTIAGARLHVRARNLPEARDLASAITPHGKESRRTNLKPAYAFGFELSLESNTGEKLLDIRFGQETAATMNGKDVSHLIRPYLSYDLNDALWLINHRVNRDETAIAGSWGIFSESIELRRALRFDEALGIFDTITGRDLGGDGTRFGLQVTTHDSGAVSIHADFAPSTLVHAFLRKYSPGSRKAAPSADPPQVIVFDRAELAFLSQVCDIMEFSNCQIEFSLQQREKLEEMKVTTYGYPRFRFSKSDGSIIPHSFLSYGQKRLLSFMYYLEASKELAIVDELVNGFHYKWIEKCLDFCAGRQTFLTSQNPLLLDSLSFASVEAAQKTFITCRTRTIGSEPEAACWKNIDRRGATAFYQALQSNFQSVSEILRANGLW